MVRSSCEIPVAPHAAEIETESECDAPLRPRAVCATEAEIFLIPVNLHDAAEAVDRQDLLRLPTAFSIQDSEVTSLIAAGRTVLRTSKEFQRLKRSLGVPLD